MCPDELPPLRVAAKCAAEMRVETLAATAAADRAQWLHERAEALAAAKACGPLYVFLRDPPDSAFAAILRSLSGERRWSVHVVAPESALRAGAHFALLSDAGVQALYLTLCGAAAEAHEARSGAPGSWRRTLAILARAPQLLERLRVGVHVTLSPETARDLPAIVRLIGRVGHRELLLWDAGMRGEDGGGLDPVMALRVLDVAVAEAHKVAVPIRPVGFERVRHVVAPIPADARVASGAIIELVRDGIPLPSAQAGLLATDGRCAAFGEAASGGRTVRGVALELAAGITARVTAIMYGRPIVATATAAARDYVQEGVNGLLVPPGDPQALAETIERLDRDPGLLASLAAGASRAARTLTTETWARALLDGSRTYDEDHWMWTKWRSLTNRWGARWRADRLRPTGPTD